MWPTLTNRRHLARRIRRARLTLRRSIRLTRVEDAVGLAFAGAGMAPGAISAFFGDQRGRLLMSMCVDLDHVEALATRPLGMPNESYRTALLVSNEPVDLAPNEDRIARWLATRANFAEDDVELVDWIVIDDERLESMSVRTGVGRWGAEWLPPADLRDAA